MTDIERAIKHFENVRDGAIVVLDSFGHKPNENPSLYKRRKLNAELAISALEKQIPKKVTDIHVDEYYCPACGSENNKDDNSNRGDDYCPICGQALDWGDA